MRKSIKISMTAGILSGTLAAIFIALFYGLPVGITGGLLTGLLSGSVLFYIIGPLHEKAVKKIAGDGYDGTTGVHRVREVEISRSFDESFDLCIMSLDLISRCSIVEKDHSSGRILAKAGLNWRTWGDTISFEISDTGEGSTRIRVSSRPAAKTTIVDFGKNLQNVIRISSYMSEHGMTRENDTPK